MANHHVLDSHGADISGEDTWQALATAQLPDGIALSNLTLLELLHKQEKVDVQQFVHFVEGGTKFRILSEI